MGKHKINMKYFKKGQNGIVNYDNDETSTDWHLTDFEPQCQVHEKLEFINIRVKYSGSYFII